MCLRGGRFFNFRKFVYIFQLFVYNFSKNLPPLKHILALPTQGQICIVTELQPLEISTFQMKHPVRICIRHHLGLLLRSQIPHQLRLTFQGDELRLNLFLAQAPSKEKNKRSAKAQFSSCIYLLRSILVSSRRATKFEISFLIIANANFLALYIRIKSNKS